MDSVGATSKRYGLVISEPLLDSDKSLGTKTYL